MELNYFPAFIQFAITGEVRGRSQGGQPGPLIYRTNFPTVDENVLNPQSVFYQEYRNWDAAIGDQHPGSPVQRIWQLFGSLDSNSNLVNTERVLNAIKARVWLGNQVSETDKNPAMAHSRKFLASNVNCLNLKNPSSLEEWSIGRYFKLYKVYIDNSTTSEAMISYGKVVLIGAI